MKKVFKKGISLFLALLMLTSGISVFASDTAAAISSPRIFIIGDSTACSYASDSDKTGWGEALQNFLTDPKMIVNAASSGDSSHSFYDEEWNWNTVKARLKKGDYLLIQFGHNDSAQSGTDDEGKPITDLSRYSNPELASTVAPPTELSTSTDDYSYKWYLKQYIEYANSVGAYPILVTSVERRGHASYTNETNSSLYKYVTAMEQLSQQEFPTVPVIDVWRGVRAGYAEDWYVSDGTHLAEKGAMEVARIFANGIKASSVASAQSLANYLVSNIDEVTTHTDILGIDEDFEDYTLPSGSYVGVGEPLGHNGTAQTDKHARIVAESATNNILQISYGASSGQYNVEYEFPYVLTTGYYRFGYRFKANSFLNAFLTNIVGGNGTSSSNTYGANIRYGAQNVNGKSVDTDEVEKATGIRSLDADKWYNVEYYLDVTKGNMDIVFEDYIIDSTVRNSSKIKNVVSVNVGFSSTTASANKAGNNAVLSLDDIEFTQLSEEDYNLALGVMPEVTLPEGITAQENFEQYSVPGTTIGTTLWGWSSYNTDAKTPITYETEPGNPANKVARFESKLNRTSTHRTLKYDLPSVLEDGVYSVKFRLRSGDDDSNTFWLSVLDTQASKNRHYIAFRLFGNEVAMVSRADGENDIVSAEYDFNLTDWFNIEVVYDLTPVDAAYATVYVNGTKVLNNVLVGGATSELNNGTINSIQFQISNAYNATQISSSGTAEDGIFAAFLLDDIVIKQTSIVTGVTASEGKVSAVSAYFDKAPSTVPKFIAAVYNGTSLKDVAFANATDTVGVQSATLSKELSVESGNTVKVYYWDMTNLIPCIKMFETDIQ